MPFKLSYLDNRQGFVCKGVGLVKGEEIISANREMLSCVASDKPYVYVLIDAEGMTGINVDATDLQETAAQDVAASARMPKFLFAFYAVDDVTFGLARMWQILVEPAGWTTHVFRKRPEAVAWLKGEVARRFGSQISLE